jgi:hypothetical protein
MMKQQRIARNRAANETYIKTHYSKEKFISRISPHQAAKKYIKGLSIPENVKVAESRLPVNSEQRKILRKELLQAEMLSKLGNAVYLIPELAAFGERPKDAVVNGELFEFRTITGNARTLEWEFSDAKKKGDNINVFLHVRSDISREETRRRLKLVLDRHCEYTGKIVISWRGGRPHFGDSNSYRQDKKNPCHTAGRLGKAELNHNPA